MIVGIEILPSLTPVDDSRFPDHSPCMPILDQRLRSLLARSPWEIPKSFTYPTWYSPTCDSPWSCASTQVADDSFSPPTYVSRARWPPQQKEKKAAPRMLHQPSVCVVDSISSRLPARSKATMHRLSSTAIGYRLPSRRVNLRTKGRICKPLR